MYKIYFYKDRRGSYPVEEFIRSLNKLLTLKEEKMPEKLLKELTAKKERNLWFDCEILMNKN